MVDKWVKPSISGYNDTPPSDDDASTSANAVSWAKHINKIGDPIKTLLDAVNTAGDTLADSLFGNAVTAISTNTTLTTSHYGITLKSTNAITITLLTGSSAGGNFVFQFFNSDSADALTLGRNGVNINGAASDLTVLPGQSGIAFSDGTDWWVFVIGTPEGLGPDIASATALPYPAYGTYSDVTGTTTVTSFDTSGKVGTVIRRHFDGVLILTHHATNLILPGGVDIVTYAGYEAEFVEYASGDWRMLSPISAVKAFVYFDGTAGTPTPITSYNVTSITDEAAGDYTINFTVDMADTDYIMLGTTIASSFVTMHSLGTQSLGSVRINTVSDSGVKADRDYVAVTILGGLS